MRYARVCVIQVPAPEEYGRMFGESCGFVTH